MFAFYVIFTALVLVLMLLTHARDQALRETFIDMSAVTEAPTMSLEGMPTPPELFKKARELMEKYDKPELWVHAANVMDKDPGQLARINLGIHND
jgi:hypothetical protein